MEFDPSSAENLLEVLQAWKEAKLPASIEGTVINLTPMYFSVNVRQLSTEERVQINGRRKRKKPKVKDESCILVTGYVGDDEKGSGASIKGSSDVPEDGESLGNLVNDMMDEVTKTAGKSYLEGVGESLMTTELDLYDIRPDEKVEYKQPVKQVSLEVGQLEEDVLELTKELKKVSRAKRIDSSIKIRRDESLFVGSNGSIIQQNNPVIEVSVEMTGLRDGKEEFTNQVYLFFRDVADYDKSKLMDEINKLSEDFDERRKAIRVTSGQYPVLSRGSMTGTIVHEVLAAHLLSGKYIADKSSTLFAGRMGELILPPFITVIDDPLLEGGIANYIYDEEGSRAERVVLVENGVLKSYLLDKTSAATLSRELGIPLYSNGRARSGWSIEIDENGEETEVSPEPRITNLIVRATNLLPEGELFELFLKTIGDYKGKNFGMEIAGLGGEIDVQEGHFSVYPQQIWRVDSNGNRKMVKDAHVSGSAEGLLDLIVKMGLPYENSYGDCGSDSGYVPTQNFAPAAIFERLNIVAEAKQSATPRLKTRIPSSYNH